ncbi:MAG TPA: hypothetical protein VEB86_16965, partial [Chryseosolibacter sp.]|nr:hypothetical protein [Chryseosolibacter sp.]
MRRLLLLLVVSAVLSCEDGHERATGQLHQYQVLPQETGNIANSPEAHYCYLDTRAAGIGKLLVFLGGTDSYPRHYQLFSKTAAALGYHVINVNYVNEQPVSKCFQAEDETCFARFHEEVLFGGAGSEVIEIDPANSVTSRILALLAYLDLHHPEQGWNQFYISGALNYGKVALAGHSQGGGHAAYLAQKYSTDRVILFAAPNDYSEKYGRPAPWCQSEFETLRTRFFGLLHARDEIASPSYQYAIWNAIGLLTAADTTSADGSGFSNAQGLVTDLDPNPDAVPRLKHNVPVRDNAIPH